MELQNIKKASELIKELEQLESVSQIFKNYDLKVYANFVTHHNDNNKTKLEVHIQLPPEIIKIIKGYVEKRVSETKGVLKTL